MRAGGMIGKMRELRMVVIISRVICGKNDI